MDDLWPADIIDTDNQIVAPVTILKEQATILGQKTKNQIIGEIGSDTITGKICHYFYITAPSISYKYQVFRTEGDAFLYPLNITIDEDIFSEAMKEVKLPVGPKNTFIVNNEDELKLCLRHVFASQKVKKLISALFATIRV